MSSGGGFGEEGEYGVVVFDFGQRGDLTKKGGLWVEWA